MLFPVDIKKIKAFSYRKKCLILISIVILWKFVLASRLELSIAEVYYWVYSQQIQWNYFDYPKAVAWLIRLTTVNSIFHSEILVRAGAIIAAGFCTWLMYLIGTVLHSRKAGWFAALLYSSSVYGSLIAGMFILPDSPQMVFWLSGILVLVKISRYGWAGSKAFLYWCLFGLLSGLCILSKVHGAFLWLGVGIAAVTIHKSWLQEPGIYVALVITLLILSPIIFWNIHYGFITLQFHGNRVIITHTGLHLYAFLKSLYL